MKIRAFCRCHDVRCILIPEDGNELVTAVHTNATSTTPIILRFDFEHFDFLKIVDGGAGSAGEEGRRSLKDLMKVVEEPTTAMRAGELAAAAGGGAAVIHAAWIRGAADGQCSSYRP